MEIVSLASEIGKFLEIILWLLFSIVIQVITNSIEQIGSSTEKE